MGRYIINFQCVQDLFRGVRISFSWGGGGAVVSKLDRLTDQSMIHK